ncbi:MULTISPECIES: MDR family MFS transporter [Vibrio]|uniref:MFS transporter n=2 Tax=Vibrio TaxID=662 RepID=A0A7X4LHD9_9VIBR|nr:MULTISPECIES: MFS transporter [Vibrio]MBF9003257.1 MFS transporter [Vibrio nitrifigilis]MZI91980.1 MFS transporter [Vibrio eleionomae]
MSVGSESLFKWHRVQRFSKPVWAVLVGTLLTRTTFFMSWPFLIVILYQDFHASEITIGIMLAASTITGTLWGLYIGYLSDCFGRKWVMVAGSVCAMLSYGGIGIATELWQFGLLIVGVGIARPMIESPAKSVISDHLENKKDCELGLNLRYFLINAGGAIGPLIGITAALSHPQGLFLLTSITYLGYGAVLFLTLPSQRHSSAFIDEQLPNFKATLSVISRDGLFVKMMVANFFLMFVYGQVDSSLQQVIVRSGLPDAAKLVAGLVMVNTITVIVFQFPLLKLMERVPLFARTRLGMVLVAVSQIGFLFSSAEWPMGWYLSAFILALGEVITFPTLSVQIDRLAPAHLRGSYFGAAALYSLGFAAAPLVGGFLIHLGSAQALYGLCFVFCLMMIGLYWIAEHQPDPRNRNEVDDEWALDE